MGVDFKLPYKELFARTELSGKKFFIFTKLQKWPPFSQKLIVKF